MPHRWSVPRNPVLFTTWILPCLSNLSPSFRTRPPPGPARPESALTAQQGTTSAPCMSKDKAATRSRSEPQKSERVGPEEHCPILLAQFGMRFAKTVGDKRLRSSVASTWRAIPSRMFRPCLSARAHVFSSRHSGRPGAPASRPSPEWEGRDTLVPSVSGDDGSTTTIAASPSPQHRSLF